MKRIFAILALLCLLLTGCAAPGPEIPDDPAPDVEQDPDPVPPVDPDHSSLYLPDIAVEDVILYFNEVCLDAEVNNGGNPTLLQKWTIPLCYRLMGEYTDEDLAVLTGFADWLNTVEGFPGIREAQEGDFCNLRIQFCPQAEMPSHMGDWATGLDGAVTFWYNNHEIYEAIICYRTDVDQEVRNSVILEEIYNGLGPVQDTSLRSDSIIYAGYSTPQSLTAMDELLLRLLYRPELVCGMDAQQCEAVIRELYY